MELSPASPHEAEVGFSLVELLVVIVILGIVGTVTLTGLVRGLQTGAMADERIEAFTDLQRAAERTTRDLRRALWTDVSSSTATIPDGCVALDLDHDELSVVVIDGTDRFLHTYTLAAGTLTMTRSAWDGASFQSPVVQPVIMGLTNGSPADPIFRYLDADGVDLVVEGGGVQDADRARVRKFVLRFETEGETSGPVSVETVVGARNGGRACPDA